MAARPPKPPELGSKNEENSSVSINTKQQKYYSINDDSPSSLKENILHLDQQIQQQQQQNQCIKLSLKNDCPCTNISIMHLFHEMKQKFPTVPDNIVNQCVISNCHDRENCIRSIQNELNLYSTTSQSYPSNALRNQNTNNFVLTPLSTPLQEQNVNVVEPITLSYDQQQLLLNNQPNVNNNNNNNNNKNKHKLLKPTRPAPVPQINLKNSNCDVAKNNSNIKFVQKKSPVSITNQQQKFICDATIPDNKLIASPPPPQRPTTLKFREPILNDNRFIQNVQETINNKSNNIQLKPIRKAPPPPVSIISPSGGNITPLSSSSSQHATPTTSSQKSYANQNFPNFDHSYSSSVQSPFSDSAESEISVNISLSPTSDRSSRIAATTTTTGQHAQPQTPRRITSITLQPEPPYTRDFVTQNPPSQRSYTSLNLTLRKPSSTPQSPIDITAGPGLSYSSSSFDAGRGLQKSFHISVNSDGGVFRASSIRPKSFYMPSISHPEEEFRNIEPPSVLRPASSEQNFYKNIMDSSNCDKFNKNIVIDSPKKIKGENGVSLQLVERQKVQKEKLIKAIEKNRKKLHQVKEEIYILKSLLPEHPGESERLDNDIEILRSNCEHFFNEIENSKRLVGQQNSSIVSDYNSSSYSQLRQRPPRPPPPRVSRLTASQSASNPVELTLSSSSMSPTSLSSNLNVAPITTTTTTTLSPTSNSNYNTATTINNLIDEDGPQWSCKHCTFLNDPLMIRCENCDYDREIPDSMIARQENIHIHLSQGENRVVHSWILS